MVISFLKGCTMDKWNIELIKYNSKWRLLEISQIPNSYIVFFKRIRYKILT